MPCNRAHCRTNNNCILNWRGTCASFTWQCAHRVFLFYCGECDRAFWKSNLSAFLFNFEIIFKVKHLFLELSSINGKGTLHSCISMTCVTLCIWCDFTFFYPCVKSMGLSSCLIQFLTLTWRSPSPSFSNLSALWMDVSCWSSLRRAKLYKSYSRWRSEAKISFASGDKYFWYKRDFWPFGPRFLCGSERENLHDFCKVCFPGLSMKIS